jgi:hypothetical protein
MTEHLNIAFWQLLAGASIAGSALPNAPSVAHVARPRRSFTVRRRLAAGFGWASRVLTPAEECSA